MSTVLTIPDIQAPFVHKHALPFLTALAKKIQPDYVVQIGDLADHHALSDYESDPDGMSAGDELKATIACLKGFYKQFPDVDVVIGNHDERIYRKAFAAGIPKAYIRPLEDVLQFPKGWLLCNEVEIDGVIYEHGHQLGGGGQGVFKKAVESNMTNTVLGHHHSLAGIQYFANKKHLCFTMVTGCLMDTHSYAAAYGKKFPSKPILGAGVVVDGVPFYQPMLLTSKGDWVGKL
jgi:metallophosphoesterase superfamily enzyme